METVKLDHPNPKVNSPIGEKNGCISIVVRAEFGINTLKCPASVSIIDGLTIGNSPKPKPSIAINNNG